jgi:hypothetical protein
MHPHTSPSNLPQVRKSQMRIFFLLIRFNSLVFLLDFLLCLNFNHLSNICDICTMKKYAFADLRKFSVRKSQKGWVRKSQIRKDSHLPKVRKFNKIFNSE